jgi:replication factor C small subunit
MINELNKLITGLNEAEKERLKNQGYTNFAFFDEADSMTSEAQLCLRTIIEKYSFNTRFIFACNDIKKIIDPLKSRCKTFSFKPITPDDMIKRLRFIISNENLSISEYQLKQIIDDSQGDFRKAINDLQSL